jgi:hypothetical protein
VWPGATGTAKIDFCGTHDRPAQKAVMRRAALVRALFRMLPAWTIVMHRCWLPY